MKSTLEKFESEYAGKVTLQRVDVDKDGQSAMQNNVMGIPTFVLYKDGKETARRSGAMPYEDFKAWVDSVTK